MAFRFFLEIPASFDVGQPMASARIVAPMRDSW
jgi:hypothetical protein